MGVALRSMALFLLAGCGASVRPAVASSPDATGDEVALVEPVLEVAVEREVAVEPVLEVPVEPVLEVAVEPVPEVAVEPADLAEIERVAMDLAAMPSVRVADHEAGHADAERTRQAFERAERGYAHLADLNFEATAVEALLEEVGGAMARASSVARDYRQAGDDTGSHLAALVGEGRVWERLAAALVRFEPDAEPSVPGITLLEEHPRPWRPAGPTTERSRVDRIVLRQAAERLIDMYVCAAMSRYVVVGRASRAALIRDASTRFALGRLAEYGDEAIAACIDSVRRGEFGEPEPTLEPYAAGELYWVRPGMIGALPGGAGVPIDASE